MRRVLASLSCVAGIAVASGLAAQDTAGRVFLPTPETVSIHEFNSLPGADGAVIPDGTEVPDLSGNGLTAVVEGNALGALAVAAGDEDFDIPAGSDRECRRASNLGQARVAVNDDGGAYEMEPADDFSIELYVNREAIAGSANWGILAGTWHSRNLIDDSVGDPDNNGAFYGYGLISHPDAFGAGVEGWGWVLSPVVDGVPRIGFGSAPEQFPQPWFSITAGRHYVVLSVDRTAQAAVGYVDGAEVTRYSNLDPTWAFITPPGRDHARFLMFNGENDSTLNGGAGTWMPSPVGAHLDAVRVQRKALTLEEVQENWTNMQDGVSSPPESELVQAVIVANPTAAVAGQCVVLDGSGSSAGTGASIAKYEWQVAGGPFEEGDAKKEVSFDGSQAQVAVALRITTTTAQTASTGTTVEVANQAVVARVSVKLGDLDVTSPEILVAKGTVLSLDGTASASVVPPGAVACPVSGGVPVEPAGIVAYDWDTDGDGTVDDTRPGFDLGPLDTVGESAVELTVRNEAGSEGSISFTVRVADPAGNSDVFHDTDDTAFHLEFNDLAESPVPDGTFIEDLTGSGLGLTIVDPVGGSLEAQAGAAQFAENGALAYVAGGAGPRGEVRDDGGIFEMDELQDFTFEIYVRPGELDQPEWGDVAGTFKARTDGTEESARYGWGIIRSSIETETTQEYMWFVCSGLGGVAEIKAPFTMRENEFNYVACVVDRAAQTSKAYVNGQLQGQVALDPAWSFATPAGYPPAPFYLFTREQVTGQFSNCPPGAAVDALRFQLVALTPEEVAENWENIASGKGANPSGVVRPTFRRGDADGDGAMNITDGIFVLNYLFLGGPAPGCTEASDSNNDAAVNITDGIYILNYLFLGGGAPPAPGPDDCGVDPDPAGEAGDLGCATYGSC